MVSKAAMSLGIFYILVWGVLIAAHDSTTPMDCVKAVTAFTVPFILGYHAGRKEE